MTLQTQGFQTLDQLRAFLDGSLSIEFKAQDRRDAYGFIVQHLSRFRYFKRRKAEKGLIVRFLCKATGLSRQQMTRLIAQFRERGAIQDRRGAPARPFQRRYTAGDVLALARMDALHGGLSGPATRKLCERAWRIFGDAAYERLATISNGHLYNLRNSRAYRRRRVRREATRAARVAIGERRRPDPQGRPGFLRVDTVHQGDLDGAKGLYHLNLVDEVTQFQFIGSCARISEHYLLPVLEALLTAFPFTVLGFHADNGSEFINHQAAALLNKLHIGEFTKSRPRRSNDNALAESKNGSTVRKHLGYAHIPARHAPQLNRFTQNVLSPYLNFHRPCFFPSQTVDAKGRIRKQYRYEDMMTPCEKLRSLPAAEAFLKDGVTFEQLGQFAIAVSDNEAAKLLNQARNELLRTIENTQSTAA